jgi:hypothetical protein
MATAKKWPIIDFSNKPLYALQREVLDDPHRIKPVAWGRQAGKSFTARRGSLEGAVNEGLSVAWISPTIPSAQGHWEALKNELEAINFPHEKREQQKTLNFPSGGEIRVRSALKPDNLRGMSPNLVILDEAAFIENGSYVWSQIILPMITASQGSVILPSTPNGRNWFYDLWSRGQGDDKFVRSWHAPSHISPFQDPEFLDYIQQTEPVHVWLEEYMAEFLVGGAGAFTNVERQLLVEFTDTPDPDVIYVAGIDWASERDFTVFTVIEKHSRRQVYGERFTGKSPTEQIIRIIHLLDHWKPQVTHVETNGVGYALWKLLRDAVGASEVTKDEALMLGYPPGITPANGSHRLRGVAMSNEIKRRIIERLSAAIEFRRLKLLDDQTPYGKVQVSEISTFVQTTTSTGLRKYEATGGAHDDTVIALALAYEGVPAYKTRKRHDKGKGKKSPFRSGKRLKARTRR